MYISSCSGCSALVHLLLKYPILIVCMGLVFATSFLMSEVDNDKNSFVGGVSGCYNSMYDTTVFSEKVAKVENRLNKDTLEMSKLYFDSMLKLDTNKLNSKVIEDVLRVLPYCSMVGYDEILSSTNATVQFSYLYFLDLIHRYKSVDLAVIAYHYGTMKLDEWRKFGKEIPLEYLDTVKAKANSIIK